VITGSSVMTTSSQEQIFEKCWTVKGQWTGYNLHIVMKLQFKFPVHNVFIYSFCDLVCMKVVHLSIRWHKIVLWKQLEKSQKYIVDRTTPIFPQFFAPHELVILLPKLVISEPTINSIKSCLLSLSCLEEGHLYSTIWVLYVWIENICFLEAEGHSTHVLF
jgi:hypothetical protein